MTKTVKAEVILEDILCRLRDMEASSTKLAKDLAITLAASDEKLAVRLSKIESEVEGVKQAAKWISIIVKVVSGLIALGITFWNLFGKITGKKI